MEQAFFRIEELGKFVEKEFPDYTDNLGTSLRMEFLRGVDAIRVQRGEPTALASLARLTQVLNGTQEGKRLQYFAAYREPFLDLHALKDARNKLEDARIESPDGRSRLESWKSAGKRPPE